MELDSMNPKYNGPKYISKAKGPGNGYNGGGWKQVHTTNPPPTYTNNLTAHPFDLEEMNKYVKTMLTDGTDYVYDIHTYLGEVDGFPNLHLVLCVCRKKRTKTNYYLIAEVQFEQYDNEYYSNEDRDVWLTEEQFKAIQTINIDSLRILYGSNKK